MVWPAGMAQAGEGLLVEGEVMHGFCEEIEIANELKTVQEIHSRWPHLVKAHIATLHPDIRDRVNAQWKYKSDAKLYARNVEVMARQIEHLNRSQNFASMQNSPDWLDGLINGSLLGNVVR